MWKNLFLIKIKVKSRYSSYGDFLRKQNITLTIDSLPHRLVMKAKTMEHEYTNT